MKLYNFKKNNKKNIFEQSADLDFKKFSFDV